ncbi:MAG: hypothetical protein IRZ21_05970 [Thermoleophilaceae bacterium]|nr:hypothetical protein [Thermoleophilaceae bacterium]
MAREGALLGAVAVIALLAAPTLSWVVRHGVNALAIISLAILIVLGVGVLGALGTPPDDRP